MVNPTKIDAPLFVLKVVVPKLLTKSPNCTGELKQKNSQIHTIDHTRSSVFSLIDFYTFRSSFVHVTFQS